MHRVILRKGTLLFLGSTRGTFKWNTRRPLVLLSLLGTGTVSYNNMIYGYKVTEFRNFGFPFFKT